MEAMVFYPGSIGEIVQGKFQGKEVLLSYPVNLFSKVELFESKAVIHKYNYPKSRRFLSNILASWNLKEFDKQLDIKIISSIPHEKGFASSTADLCGVYYALLKLFNKSFIEEELVKECIKIEPTDSIIFNEFTAFDYKEGLLINNIGRYFEFHILVFEGNRNINTVRFNNENLPMQKSVDDLVISLKNDYTIETLSKVATESIIRNQHRLSYSILPYVLKVQESTGGLGVIGAHSGDVLAIVYYDERSLNNAINKIKNIQGYKMYKLKTINKEQINRYIDCDFGGSYETAALY
jgi:L-threonine kinase